MTEKPDAVEEDDRFERELREAQRIADVHGSMEPYARVLSGRLRQMDKRAKAANSRADHLEAEITALRASLAAATARAERAERALEHGRA